MTLDELDEAWTLLDNREKTIIKGRFGLNGDKPRTLEQIGKTLGVQRERIRQLQNIALSKLRRAGVHFEKYGEIRHDLLREPVVPIVRKIPRPKPVKRRPRKPRYVPPPLVRHTETERLDWMEDKIKNQSLYIEWKHDVLGSSYWTLKLEGCYVHESSLRDLLDRAMMQ